MSNFRSFAGVTLALRTALPRVRVSWPKIIDAIRQRCRGGALLLLAVVLALGFGAKFAGFRAEDVQILLFPLVVATLLAIPREKHFRLPLFLGLTAILLWSLSVFHMRVIEPSRYENRDVLVLSRLSGDENSVLIRQFQKRYAEVASTYDLPEALLLERSFSSAAESARWLRQHADDRLFLVRGSKDWLQVVFNPQLRVAPMHSDAAQPRTFEGGHVHELALPWAERPLLLGELPPFIQLAAQPREFSIHALAWLSDAVAFAGAGDVNTRARMRDALAQVIDTASTGLSDGIAGIGQHLQALTEVLEFQAQGYVGRERVEAAIESLRDAARFVKMKEEPELFSLIFNNAGVALFSIAETPEELYRAHFWLRVAHDAAQFGERRAFGTRLAMENLLRVEEDFSHWALQQKGK